MIDLQEVDKASVKALEIRELLQQVKMGTPTEANNCPQNLWALSVKGAGYITTGNSVLMDGRMVVLAILRAKVLAKLHH